MSEHIISDADTIKALECCNDLPNNCKECPFKQWLRYGCQGMLIRNSLKLIKRISNAN